jgi:hemolysin III
MTHDPATPAYTRRDDIASAVTHGLGAVLSAAGLGVLVALVAMSRDPWRIVSCAVYGTCLLLLYLSSTLYHAFPGPRAKRVFQVIDHSSIYLLIAGTYTPFLLVNLRGGWGWALFIVIWGLTAAGIVFQVFFAGRMRLLHTLIYLAMGWLVVAVAKPLLGRVPPAGLALLLAGGLAYSIGVIFYLVRRLPYHHALWHLFVLAGSVLHYLAVLFSVRTR